MTLLLEHTWLHLKDYHSQGWTRTQPGLVLECTECTVASIDSIDKAIGNNLTCQNCIEKELLFSIIYRECLTRERFLQECCSNIRWLYIPNMTCAYSTVNLYWHSTFMHTYYPTYTRTYKLAHLPTYFTYMHTLPNFDLQMTPGWKLVMQIG